MSEKKDDPGLELDLPRYLHKDKPDTFESALLSARLFAVALGAILVEGEYVLCSLDGHHYKVGLFNDQVSIFLVEDPG